MKRDLGEYLHKKKQFDENLGVYKEDIYLSQPELNFIKRPYNVPKIDTDGYPIEIPDFQKLSRDFYSNLSIHIKITMIWAIAYSRIDNSRKCSLLREYYCEETYYSMYRVCLRTNNDKLLKWMLKQQ